MDLELMKPCFLVDLLLHHCIYVDLMMIGVYYGAGNLRWRSVVRDRKRRWLYFVLLCFIYLCILLHFCMTHRIELDCIILHLKRGRKGEWNGQKREEEERRCVLARYGS